MATVIQIKRPSSGTSVTAPTQSNITTAEMAYVYGTADQTNGGQRLYIGNAAGNGVKVIGGEYFTEMLNHVHGTLTASSALIADSNKKLDNEQINSLIDQAEQYEKNSNQILEFTQEVKKMDFNTKRRVLEFLWKIILSDNKSDVYESNLMRRICGLLYLPDKLSGEIKLDIIRKNKNDVHS